MQQLPAAAVCWMASVHTLVVVLRVSIITPELHQLMVTRWFAGQPRQGWAGVQVQQRRQPLQEAAAGADGCPPPNGASLHPLHQAQLSQQVRPISPLATVIMCSRSCSFLALQDHLSIAPFLESLALHLAHNLLQLRSTHDTGWTTFAARSFLKCHVSSAVAT